MVPRPSPDVVFCPVETGAVLLHAGQEVYFGLNEVGAEIWQLLAPASMSLEDIVSGLKARHAEIDASVLRADVLELLASLQSNGLLLGDDA